MPEPERDAGSFNSQTPNVQRKETFRPPFAGEDKSGALNKNRADSKNFTFSRKDTEARNMQIKSQENPFKKSLAHLIQEEPENFQNKLIVS